MIRKIKKMPRLAVVLALTFLTTPATAAPKAVNLSAAEKADVDLIERYLNNIKTLQADFLQISSNGAHAQGKLSISRPGRLRIEYDPPTPIEIIANGSWLIYHDKEMKQADHYPLNSTPAGILVGENILLSSGDLTITGFERDPGVIQVTVVRNNDPDGTLTLVFSERPLALKKWLVTDVQGVVTSVSLIGSRSGMPLDPDMFSFVDPYPSSDQN
ncbi:MAG: hypothetical protein A3G18_04385 [Rhodospirillales bacterium RIFCSPLOWO2_12_FULL_58_28]|nr:MAG: hypothetical protein A3H92_02515 [Rhodospirillales bacterium RIFCSPLOWO2_02_FULL_58_16]OHC77397.1 MAG: hypothetical protein A3G18_04385 [Rhodospirillales bacterium RIFCSPLOWO2_12_FULL_58_28]